MMTSALLVLMYWVPDGVPGLLDQISRSGRVIESVSSSERLADPLKQIAPGAPPLLAFRYFNGADRHRFGKLDLMVDDAGH